MNPYGGYVKGLGRTPRIDQPKLPKPPSLPKLTAIKAMGKAARQQVNQSGKIPKMRRVQPPGVGGIPQGY